MGKITGGEGRIEESTKGYQIETGSSSGLHAAYTIHHYH